MIVGKFYTSKKHGLTSIYYRIRYNRETDLKVTLKHIRINAESWDFKNQKFKKNCIIENYVGLTIHLKEFDKYIYDLQSNLILQKSNLNTQILKEHYYIFFNLQPAKESGITNINGNSNYLDFYNYYIDLNKVIDNQSINGKNLTKNSLKGYKTMINTWIEFSKKYGYQKLSINKIDENVFQKYIHFQESEKKLGKGSIATNKNKFNAILNYARKKGNEVHEEFILGAFKYSDEKTNEIYLNQEEINKIIKLDIKDYSLNIVKEWFIIQLHTALRISDLFNLSPLHFKNDFIELKTLKTKKEVVIPIINHVRKIVNNYNGNLPPIISESFYNKKIKEICKIAQIDDLTEGSKVTYIDKEKKIKRKVKGIFKKYELVSSHTARRSYITILSQNPEITNYEIMTVSGHTNTKTLDKYVRSSNYERANSLLNKLIQVSD